jgi:hypothetical protein
VERNDVECVGARPLGSGWALTFGLCCCLSAEDLLADSVAQGTTLVSTLTPTR